MQLNSKYGSWEEEEPCKLIEGPECSMTSYTEGDHAVTTASTGAPENLYVYTFTVSGTARRESFPIKC
jgi:hypothetical protein